MASSSGKFLLLFIAVLCNFRDGFTLECTNCFSRINFEECGKMALPVECTIAIANDNHNKMNQHNPTLVEGTLDNFQCYRIEVNVTGNQKGYARGCTFANTDFCNGWNNDFTVVSCGTCTADNCDSIPVESTQSTVIPAATTTTNPSNGSTSSKIIKHLTIVFAGVLLLLQ